MMNWMSRPCNDKRVVLALRAVVKMLGDVGVVAVFRGSDRFVRAHLVVCGYYVFVYDDGMVGSIAVMSNDDRELMLSLSDPGFVVKLCDFWGVVPCCEV